MERPLDLSVFRRDACALDDKPTAYVKIEMPDNQNVDGIRLVRVGVDLFSVPTLLRRWATKIETDLSRPGQVPEMIVEEDAPDADESRGPSVRNGNSERGGGASAAVE